MVVRVSAIRLTRLQTIFVYIQEVVWEHMSDVHGNNEFARADFTCPSNKAQSHVQMSIGPGT